ncbi:hypothetical protein LY76DRAFT_394518 [Colletotrichum caudatum]|nr:hypothetical protein LY76DRAFT_394518 [Colletotrichum caudatum]
MCLSDPSPSNKSFPLSSRHLSLVLFPRSRLVLCIEGLNSSSCTHARTHAHVDDLSYLVQAPKHPSHLVLRIPVGPYLPHRQYGYIIPTAWVAQLSPAPHHRDPSRKEDGTAIACCVYIHALPYGRKAENSERQAGPGPDAQGKARPVYHICFSFLQGTATISRRICYRARRSFSASCHFQPKTGEASIHPSDSLPNYYVAHINIRAQTGYLVSNRQHITDRLD